MANVTPARHEDVDQSTNRQPTLSTTSADDASAFPMVDPVSPMVWPARGWVSSIAPLPFQVVTTGAPSRSASARSSAVASAEITPPPATMTGRFAPASSAARALHHVGVRPRDG